MIKPFGLGMSLAVAALAVPVQAQVPSYMPAIIGATVGNAVAANRTYCGAGIPDEVKTLFSQQLDEVVQHYVNAAAADDGLQLRKLFAQFRDGGEMALNGTKRSRAELAASKTPPNVTSATPSDLTRIGTVFGNEMARGQWKALTADADGKPQEIVYTADFVRGFFSGDWSIARVRQSLLSDAPKLPEKLCSLHEATLW